MSIRKILKSEGITSVKLMSNFWQIKAILKSKNLESLDPESLKNAIHNIKNPLKTPDKRKVKESELKESDNEGKTVFASFFLSYARPEGDELPWEMPKFQPANETNNPNIKIVEATAREPRNIAFYRFINEFIANSKISPNEGGELERLKTRGKRKARLKAQKLSETFPSNRKKRTGTGNKKRKSQSPKNKGLKLPKT